MRHVLLITLQGPSRTVDVAIAGDARISDMLPLILDLCASEPSSLSRERVTTIWSIEVIRLGRSLKSTQSFFANGVLDGDVLLLHATNTRSLQGR